MTRLIRLFPDDWRHAYGEEVADMLAASTHPWRDRTDVFRVALMMRLEKIDMRTVYALAAVLITAGVLGGVWVTPQLASGITEIPQHWWSAFAVLPAVVGVGLPAVAWARRFRTAQPDS